MIEIIILLALSRKIGATVEAKGHKKFPYQFLLCALWFGGEIGGGIAGALVSAFLTGDEPSMGFIYLFALSGAVVGAVIAFAIAMSLKPVERDDYRDPDYPDDVGRRFDGRAQGREDITDRPTS